MKCNILGEEIFYRVEDNNKEKVLCIHGFASSLNIFNKLFQEDKDFDIIALDLPGSGLSTSNTEVTFDFLCNLVIEFLSKNNFKIKAIITHSLGSIIGLKVAEAMNINNIVMLSPFHPYVQDSNPNRDKSYTNFIPKTQEEAVEVAMSLVANKDKVKYFNNIERIGKSILSWSVKHGEKNRSMVENTIYNNDFKLTCVHELFKKHCNSISIVSGIQDEIVESVPLHKTVDEFSINSEFLSNCGHSPLFEQYEQTLNFIKNSIYKEGK